MEWETLEYEHFDKDAGWYKTVAILTIVGLILSLLLWDFLLTLILLVGGFSVMIYGARTPHPIHVKLTSKGIVVEKNLFLYSKLRSFSINEEHGETRIPKLVVEADRLFLPHLIIPLFNVDKEKVRTYLLSYLPEEHHEETFADVIFDLLHF